MKRLLIIGLIIASTTMVYAQDYLGIQIGYAQPTTRLNTPESKTVLKSTIYNGFKLGVIYDATLIKGFGVSMGLNYTYGGNATDWKKVGTNLYPSLRTKGQYHQIELPVDWQYKFQIAKSTYIMLYTGPTLQCGLSLQSKNFLNNGKEIQLTDVDNYYSETDMQDRALKRLNVTWGVGAGLQYERYFIRGGYDFGLINPYQLRQFPGEDVYTRGRIDQWQLKVGIYLWQF